MNASIDERPAAAAGWRWRDREWAWLAAATCVACVVFSLWPDIDLKLAGLFFLPGHGFIGDSVPLVRWIYVSVPWLGRATGVVALLVALLWFRGPNQWLGVRWWRRLQVLGLAMLIGVAGFVNGALKEYWGRARPSAVEQFGGSAVFAPALRPTQQCQTNCSFVTGHAATGFAVAALGLLGSPVVRRRWLLIGAATGLVIGLARMSQGAHFASDVVFAGLVVWLANLVVRAVWLRVVAGRRRRARFRVVSPPASS